MRRIGLAMGLSAAALGACAVPELPSRAPTGQTGAQPAQTAPRYRLAAIGPLAPQTVDASSQLASNPAGFAIDQNAGTAWSDGGYKNATSWLRLRFGADVPLASVAVRMPPAPAGTSYDLQVSGDGSAWTTALAGQKNTTWNTETKTLPAGTHGRYLRLFWRNSSSAPQPHVAIYEIAARGDAGATPSQAPSSAPSTSPTATPTPSATAPPTGLPQAANPGPRAVAGLIYNNGRPVAGIAIKVGSVSLTTDAQGRYLATNLPNGSYQAYYYNPSDRNKIGYWRSRAVSVDGTKGARMPTIDLYLVGMMNTPASGASVRLPTTFTWKPPIQQPAGYYFRIHDRPYTSFVLVYQSTKLPGTATSYGWNGSGPATLNPTHRYFWGVQWDWGPLGMGGNLYQPIYMTR